MINSKDVDVRGGNFFDSYSRTLRNVSEEKTFLFQLNSYHIQRLDTELQYEDLKINGMKMHSIS
jgi:hypothetical protein